MKVLKNFNDGRLSVTVTKIDQAEEVVSVRPLDPNEDFSVFHPTTTPLDTNSYNPDNNQQNTPFVGSYTKNVGGFGINVTRKLK